MLFGSEHFSNGQSDETENLIMANKHTLPTLIVIEETPNNETTYMVDKCIVKTKFLPEEETAASKPNLEYIREVLFSTLGI